jgi:membrane protease YdiL (CAAX protease family)
VALLLTVCVVAYNNVLNLWSGFHGWWAVGLNACATCLLLAIAIWRFHADAETLGLNGPHARGALIGTAAAVIIVVPLFIALAHPDTAVWVEDRRAGGLDRGELVFRTLIRIPIATALLEEVAFRSVLPAAWKPAGRIVWIAVPSLAFGLWHIVPAMEALEANRPGAPAAAVALATAGSVVVTAGAGVLLMWLRLRTRTLAAPFCFHATLNSLATVAAWLAIGRA